MKNIYKVFFSFLLCFILTISLTAAVTAQEKADKEKLFKEIAGEYEFDAEGQIIVITFLIEDGKLMGMQEGSDELAELEPVEGEELEFMIITPDGQEFEAQFVRDEKTKKIKKCILVVDGMEYEGTRITDGR